MEWRSQYDIDRCLILCPMCPIRRALSYRTPNQKSRRSFNPRDWMTHLLLQPPTNLSFPNLPEPTPSLTPAISYSPSPTLPL